jgi:hypothetical protein
MGFVFNIADQLLDCFRDELEAAPNVPGKICMRAGEVPFDAAVGDNDCCTGLAWVRVVRVYPSLAFPDEQTEPMECVSDSYGIDLEMGVVRCHDVGTATTVTPCTSWTSEALQLDDDRAAMRRAICCFVDSTAAFPFGDNQFVFGEWAPVGPAGGCIGGTMVLTVQAQCGEC